MKFFEYQAFKDLMRRNKGVNIRLINKLCCKFNDYRYLHTNTFI